jgi:hypothetical protein
LNAKTKVLSPQIFDEKTFRRD